MKILFLLFVNLFLLSQTFAQTALEWQKVQMEDRITGKIRDALSKILTDKEYMVEADVRINDPGAPNFDDLQKVGLKVSDIDFDDSKGDYIAFSKIGLEVPVIEKYYNDHQQKLKELHKFNEGYNLFKNLDGVDIKIFFSDLLSEEKMNQSKKVVESLRFPLGDIKPKISYDKMSLEMEMKNPVANGQDRITLKDILTWISEFGNAFGLIIATILFGLFAKKLLRLWEEIMQNMVAKQANEEKAEEESIEEEENAEDALAMNAEDGLFDELESEDFERFKKFMEKSKQDTILMLKRWISIYDEKFKLALKAVAQQLKDDELIEIFSGLNDREREKWKDSLDQFMDLETIKTTNKFISEEVVRSMIGPNQVDDIELIDMLLSLSDDIAVKFLDQKKEEAKILMNLLTPQFSGKILDQLPEDKAQQVIMNSLSFDFNQIKDNFAGFKKTLKDFIEVTKRKPFSDKIVQMLPDFNPLKESMLYEFLASSGMKQEMKLMARENFPSVLIGQLPKGFLKKALNSYDKDQRVLLLSSLDGQLKESLISSFAEEGSASREMLNLEFEEIANNQIAQAKIKNRKDDLWKDFVVHTRLIVKDDQEFGSDFDMIIQGWVDEMTSSNVKSA
jgi:hypothetical protein